MQKKTHEELVSLEDKAVAELMQKVGKTLEESKCSTQLALEALTSIILSTLSDGFAKVGADGEMMLAEVSAEICEEIILLNSNIIGILADRVLALTNTEGTLQ